MKRKLLLIGFVSITVALFANYMNETSIADKLNIFKLDYKENKLVDEKIKKNIEVLKSVPSVEKMKDDLQESNDLTNVRTLEVLLDEKEKKLSELQLIRKANSGKLSAQESKVLLVLMREKIALNQMILEEKMKQFEGEYL